MRYDREMMSARRRAGRGGEWIGRGEYGAVYEAPYRAGYHGYGMGYAGGALRSRGSFEAGQLRSGLNPVDEFVFEWGGGYLGGRGYGGTNYDLQHGYRVGSVPRSTGAARALPPRPVRWTTAPARRRAESWAAFEEARGRPRGPARYGYGPYHERLRRRARPDDEIRSEIEETLFFDTWVDAERITVTVVDGVATLRGNLPNFDEVRYATDDAWDVDGVRGVRTELTVQEPRRSGPLSKRPPADRPAHASRPAAREAAGRAAPAAPARRGTDAPSEKATDGAVRSGRGKAATHRSGELATSEGPDAGAKRRARESGRGTEERGRKAESAESED